MGAVTLPLALLAGIVSFASPCFLPIVPVFIGQVVGDEQASRGVALRQSSVFVLGFSIVFIGLWVSIGLVGWSLGDHRDLMRIVGGVVLVLLGLQMSGLVDLPFLSGTLGGVRSGQGGRKATVRRGLLLGLAFGAGWTPCIGPILGGILALASTSGSSAQGALLLVAYCLGLGIPFVAVSLGAGWVRERLAWFTRHEMAVQLVSGALLAVTGFLMITNQFARLSAFAV